MRQRIAEITREENQDGVLAARWTGREAYRTLLVSTLKEKTFICEH